MAATTTTIRPLHPTTYFASYPSWSITGGSANVPAALNDYSDSTYVTSSSWGSFSSVVIPMAAYTLPAGEHPTSITPRIRVRRPTGSGGSIVVAVRPAQLGGLPINRLTGATAGQEQFALYPWRSVVIPTNSGATAFTTYTAPTMPVTDTLVTHWEVAVYFSQGARTCSIVEVYLDVVSTPLGTVTLTLPNDPVVDTTRPAIAGTVTDPEGEGVRMVRYLYDAATYGAPGFDPWTDYANAVEGWTDTTSAEQYNGTTDLIDGTTYRVYAWPYYGLGCTAAVTRTFTMDLSQPIAPTVQASWDPVNARSVIGVAGHANVLTTQQASMEASGTTGFTVGTNCSLARTTTQAKSGVASLQVTATAAATFNVRVAPSGTYTDWVPVIETTAYTFTASGRSAVTARAVTLGLAWYNAAGTLISTTTGPSTNDATGSWTTLSLIATAPTTAVYVVPIVTWDTAAASEVHYVDELALYPGTAATTVNLLADPFSSFETGTTQFNSGFSSATISVSAVRAQHGVNSVLCTWGSGTGGNLAVANFYGLTPGQTYTLSLYAYVVSGAAVTIGAPFGGPTFVATPAGTTAVTSGTGSWQRLGYTFTATAGNHVMGISAGAGNLTGQSAHIDSVQLEVGTAATAFGVAAAAWSVGGTTAYELVVERSSDGGLTWTTVRPNAGATRGASGGTLVDAATQSTVVYDYEAERGVELLYRAVERATYGTGVLPSALSTNAAVTSINDGSWWIKAATDPTLNLGGVGVLRVARGSLQFQQTEDVGTFRPLGRSLAVVVGGDLGGQDGALTLTSLGAAEWDELLPLLTFQGALLLQDPDGSQKYVRINEDRAWSRDAGAAGRRTVPVSYVEVDRP